jgi:hypothetical protein
MESSVSAAKMLRCDSEVRPNTESKYFLSALTVSLFCGVKLLEKDFTKTEVAESNKLLLKDGGLYTL